MKTLLPPILLLVTTPALAGGHLHPERWYQEQWCKAMGRQTEVVLPDKTRVDCLTDEYAIEVDFAPKWAEGIGQALYYALMTERKPGVLLILERPSDQRHLIRLNQAGKAHKIAIWTMKEGMFFQQKGDN